jgi:hypothetical protein
MSAKPLATVECVYAARDQFHDDEWAIVVGERIEQHLPKSEAMAIAATINAAHEAALAPLRAQLAIARAELVSIHGGRTVHDIEPKPDCPLCRAIQAIDEPGEWVPKQKLDEALAVLADLREEKRDVWRERCEKALAALTSSKTRNASGTYFNYRGAEAALSILEGREPLPPIAAFRTVDAEGRPVTVIPSLPAIHRGGYTGDDE